MDSDRSGRRHFRCDLRVVTCATRSSVRYAISTMAGSRQRSIREGNDRRRPARCAPGTRHTFRRSFFLVGAVRSRAPGFASIARCSRQLAARHHRRIDLRHVYLAHHVAAGDSRIRPSPADHRTEILDPAHRAHSVCRHANGAGKSKPSEHVMSE